MAGGHKNRISGWLPLDKPEGMSSALAVAVVRRIFNAAKTGHAGTLDPMASGLLPIAFGEATKTASFLAESEKTYRFTLRFGIGTDSDDAEGNIIATSKQRPADEQIAAHLGGFIGSVDQTPPIFSAIKKDGRRAYQRARSGEIFTLPARRVQIYDLRFISRPGPDHAVMEMRCGKGVYVRAIARDLGKKLGCWAHIAQLRRITAGRFTAKDMISLDKIKQIDHNIPNIPNIPNISACNPQRFNALSAWLQPLETALEGLPKITLAPDKAERLKQGQSIILKQSADIASDQPIFVRTQNHAVALARFKGGQLKPLRVFNS